MLSEMALHASWYWVRVPQTQDDVQDPVARIYSAWKMTRREFCKDGQEPCIVPDFVTSVAQNLNVSSMGGCLFDSPVRSIAIYLWLATLLVLCNASCAYCLHAQSVSTENHSE